ncbi:MAG TPA: allantoicase [Vicinamibacterales bacterium]|jgi:allantoicase|nr:allantoicase [Vicinamibacterales bacterium]
MSNDNTPLSGVQEVLTSLPDLASERIGGRAIAASDDFFAPRRNLVKASEPVFVPDRFTSRGKWMDGWESRRRRTPGHDWCVVKLGVRGRIRGVNVNTRFFTGNFPTSCSIDALHSPQVMTQQMAAHEGAPWTTILPQTDLRGDGDNFIAIDSAAPWTHVRLNIFPDGGVARLRVFGEAVVDWKRVAAGGRGIDLARIEHGGVVLGASDMHYGARDNIIMPGRAANMGDGWETKRRRGPGHDWLILRLGAPGRIQKLEIDTNHFKGNYPDAASVDACHVPGAGLEELSGSAWTELLPRVKLQPHHRHFFLHELRRVEVASHLRLNIFPDGGVSRFRVYGTLASD